MSKEHLRIEHPLRIIGNFLELKLVTEKLLNPK